MNSPSNRDFLQNLRRLMDHLLNALDRLFQKLDQSLQNLFQCIRHPAKCIHENNKINHNIQQLIGLALLFFIGFTLQYFAVKGNTLFEKINFKQIAQITKITNIFYTDVPLNVLEWFTLRFSLDTAPYMIAPAIAILSVIIAGAIFVQDIYNLKNFETALQHVISSLFALRYPKIRIDKGKKIIEDQEINLLDDSQIKIGPDEGKNKGLGGPGFALVQPGNAVIFRRLRNPSNFSTAQPYFLSHFETIGTIITLAEQHGEIDMIETVTKDHMPIKVKNIQYRFKALEDQEAALMNMTNASINKHGMDDWHKNVQKPIRLAIKEYVNRHTINFLTAPREDVQDPRRELHDIIMFNKRFPLMLQGAELLWVDIGTFETEKEVGEQYASLWAVRRNRSIKPIQAKAEAQKLHLEQLGRSRANADMISAITNVLRDSQINPSSKDNVMSILLTQTNQILDAYQKNTNPEQKKLNDKS
ncbi:MAG: hypothetical protein JEZ06_01960 [Anaerolineaceae bacterium]|nr:hypothetical protein [Anaerolineaceae bacterium]